MESLPARADQISEQLGDPRRDLVQLVLRLAACAYAVHAELVGSAAS